MQFIVLGLFGKKETLGVQIRITEIQLWVLAPGKSPVFRYAVAHLQRTLGKDGVPLPKRKWQNVPLIVPQ